jgi:hypothetical protein
MNPAARGANDELVNLALIGLVAAFAPLQLRPPWRRVRPRPKAGSRPDCVSSPIRAIQHVRSAPPGCQRSPIGAW